MRIRLSAWMVPSVFRLTLRTLVTAKKLKKYASVWRAISRLIPRATVSHIIYNVEAITKYAFSSGISQTLFMKIENRTVVVCLFIDQTFSGGGRITSFSSWALMLLASSAIVLSKFL